MLKSYGESRDTNFGRYSVYKPQSRNRVPLRLVEHGPHRTLLQPALLQHRRRPHSAQPLDHHIIALGGYISF